MPFPITCDCGQCLKCRRRVYMREYYARNGDKMRESVRRYRARKSVEEQAAQDARPRCVGVSHLKGHFGTRRCLRKGRFQHKGNWYCRTHRPRVALVEEEVYEDTIAYCACGCGEVVNQWIAVFKTLARDGLTHRAIAERFNFDRPYVSAALRTTPRFVQGHNARKQAAALYPRESNSEDAGIFAHNVVSLETPMRMIGTQPHTDKPVRIGETIFRVADDAAVAFEKDERSRQLAEIVGDVGIEDIARMDATTLDRIRDKLLEAGIRPGVVQEQERERLRDPQAHSGSGIAKAHGRSTKRKRLEKVKRTEIKKATGRSRRPEQKPRKRWEREAA